MGSGQNIPAEESIPSTNQRFNAKWERAKPFSGDEPSHSFPHIKIDHADAKE